MGHEEETPIEDSEYAPREALQLNEVFSALDEKVVVNVALPAAGDEQSGATIGMKCKAYLEDDDVERFCL